MKNLNARVIGTIFLAISVLLACVGCDTTKSKSRQLARVAKDWSLLVRASQVLPVYPLTEDIQPGDVFLVRTRMEDQVKVFEERGFLPLDQLLARLQPTNYARFYLEAYGIGTNSNTPYHWKFSTDPDKTNDFDRAPRAAFPTYSFSVKRGGGLNLAIPVQGVPVALGLLGAASAHGDIVIADAYTFGIDIASLRPQVQAWARSQTNFLLELAPTEQATNYLRVVNRVYWTGRVNISLFDDSSFAGTASGGAPKEVILPALKSGETAENQASLLQSLNSALSDAVPGGTLKVAAASSRSVSLIEEFRRPLVIGYLGFDLPILADGQLGAPVPTQAALQKAKIIPQATTYGVDRNTARIERWLRAEPQNRQRLRQWLSDNGHDEGLTNILRGKEFKDLREQIVNQFDIPAE
jgi:hypothetical protein